MRQFGVMSSEFGDAPAGQFGVRRSEFGVKAKGRYSSEFGVRPDTTSGQGVRRSEFGVKA
jgi:hypothetical protein